MMIHVGKYNDAYNFIKFWMATADYRANHGTMDCKENEFSLKNQDPTENMLEFMKYKKCLLRDCLFYVYLVIIKIKIIKDMEQSGNESLISKQKEHIDIYLQYIQRHYPGFLWNFVNFDYLEEDFIVPNKPKYNDVEDLDGETLFIFGPPICTAAVYDSEVKEKIKRFLLKGKCGPNRLNHGWKQIRKGEPSGRHTQRQEFTLLMYEKVFSLYNQRTL